MRISHEKKFVFLANPRTASTSLRAVLEPYSDISSILISEITREFPFYHHITASELKKIFDRRGWNWDTYFKFCVVRNPYERIVSLYNHQEKIYRETSTPAHFIRAARKYGLKHSIKMLLLNLARPRSFKTFLKRIDTSKNLTISLKNFCFDENDQLLVDSIIKFEELQAELPPLLKRIGIEISEADIPKLNSAARERSLIEYYDKEALQIMQDLYGYEIRKFNYSPT